MASSYILAGVDTFCMLMSRFISSNSGFMTEETLNKFVLENVDKFLYSFGSGLNYKTQKISKNFVDKFIKNVDKMRDCSFMKGTKLFWDSGGFQVANGAIKLEDMSHFCDMYYNAVANYSDKTDYAFILDLPPGPGSKEIFKFDKQVEDVNRISYEKCIQLVPAQIRKDKVIYIHHFRTPALFETWNKFLFEENLADGYDYFGTGGIVVSMSSDMQIPIIIYAIPLSSVLKYVVQKGMKQFKFHVLGGANFQDLFYHQLFTHHIKQVHNIDVEITYDSSSIYKGLSIGRFVHVLNNLGHLVKLDLRSSNLPLRFDDHTVEDHEFRIVTEISKKYNFKNLDKLNNPIYDLVTNSLARDHHMYLICHVLRMYEVMQEKCKEYVHAIYDLYTPNNDDKNEEFNRRCNEMTISLNQGRNKLKSKHRIKAFGLSRTLDILTNLDMNKNKELVERYLPDANVVENNPNPTW